MDLLEWIVSIDAMITVSTRRVIDSTAVVCMAVKRVTDALRVKFSDFDKFLNYAFYKKYT